MAHVIDQIAEQIINLQCEAATTCANDTWVLESIGAKQVTTQLGNKHQVKT